MKFSVVGVVNTLIHYALFYLLYSVFGVYHLLASTIGFIAAVINSFFFNKYWTFNSKSPNLGQQFVRFFIVSLLGLLINLMTMALLVEWLLIDPLLAQLAAIGLTLLVNFSGNKWWAFRHG
ncbi:MAG: GtrA family protein [Gammaproteobacteria bacterium]|nr:GtrA family protein [Gammaproteobacteria bacterium]